MAVVVFGLAGAVLGADETAAIQARIDECAARGGGRVVIEKGEHLSYTLYLRSNVELHLEEGAVLKGGPDGLAYPEFPHTEVWCAERAPRFNRRAFIYACGATNVSITGRGTIHGNAKVFHHWSEERRRWVRNSDTNLTGRCVFFAGCRDVRVKDALIKDSTGWATWFLDCDNLLVDGLRINCDLRFMNGDGIHLGGCRDVVVRNCDVVSEDDALILRAHQEQMRVPRALERVLVTNCTFYAERPCGVRIGWAHDAPVKDVLVVDSRVTHSGVAVGCRIPPTDPGKCNDPPRRTGTMLRPDRPYLPFAIENVRFVNCEFASKREGVRFDYYWDGKLPGREGKLEVTAYGPVKGLVFRNCRFRHGGEKETISVPRGFDFKGAVYENCEALKMLME